MKLPPDGAQYENFAFFTFPNLVIAPLKGAPLRFRKYKRSADLSKGHLVVKFWTNSLTYLWTIPHAWKNLACFMLGMFVKVKSTWLSNNHTDEVLASFLSIPPVEMIWPWSRSSEYLERKVSVFFAALKWVNNIKIDTSMIC